MKSQLIRRSLAGLALALTAVVGIAQPPPAEKKQHNFTEKTSEGLKKLGELQQQQPTPYAAMLAHVEGLLAQAPAGSYDQAFLLNTRAKVLAGMDKYAAAVDPWEQALKLHDQHHYFDPKEANDIRLWVAQLIFSEAANIKDPKAQSAQIHRSLAYLKQHLDNAPPKGPGSPTMETRALYAQLLYQQAVVDPNNINQDLLKQARTVVDQAMSSTLQPKEAFYLLKLAIMQQQNEMESAGELLELFLKKFPTKKDYWPILMGVYLNLASNEKNPERQRELYIRAIHTIERAQKQGFMQAPRDNYNLVTIYITAGQFGKATDLLHAGLKSGAIESTLANWRVLASYYQQINKEKEAIETLREAIKLFPKEGMLDLQIGEINRQMEKTKEAREAYRAALAKGNLDKPQVAYQLLAYTSMELDDWAEAKRAIDEAAKHPDFEKDQQMKSLREHINNTLREREEAAKAKAEAKTDQEKKK